MKLGTRGSPLALWQAEWVRAALENGSGRSVELVRIRTTGDRILDRPLADIGGKGLFTRELDRALLGGRIDLAVHSLKDLPFRLEPGLTVAAVMPRGNPLDALVSNGLRLEDLTGGARVGTGSLRRRAQILHHHPRLDLRDLRGNVDTRLAKLDSGEFDALVLSAAGLERLGHGARITETLSPDRVLPAVGQGAVAVVCRQDDAETVARLAGVDDPPTHTAVRAERALLEVLEGNCKVPIAGYAAPAPAGLRLRALVAAPDGSRLLSDELEGDAGEPAAIGRRLGRRLLEAGAAEILGRGNGR
jgi:hydroxymethylbilane synthase